MPIDKKPGIREQAPDKVTEWPLVKCFVCDVARSVKLCQQQTLPALSAGQKGKLCVARLGTWIRELSHIPYYGVGCFSTGWFLGGVKFGCLYSRYLNQFFQHWLTTIGVVFLAISGLITEIATVQRLLSTRYSINVA